jgi:ankyrin repeat protein
VEELAEVLTIDFSSTNGIPKVNEKLRWGDQEQAVLSACSSLVTVVEDRGSRLIQFSHFSVKEFLTSDRLAASMVDGLRYHHIRLKAAHTITAQACLGVLLNLDDSMDADAIRDHPLAKYAGFYFGVHAEFGDVLSHSTDGVDNLLDPDKPHFNIWVWLQIGDWDTILWHNSRMTAQLQSACLYHRPQYPPRVAPLYYVAALGYLGLSKRLISKSPQDLDSKDKMGCTPLHISVLARNCEVTQLLLRHTVDFGIRDVEDYNLLHMVAWKGQWEVAQMLLEHEGVMKVLVRMRNKNGQTPLHLAVQDADPMIAELLINFGADVDAMDNYDMSPLHWALKVCRNDATAQLLLAHGANFLVSDSNGWTPLHSASRYDHPSIVELLLKSGADIDVRDNENMTPLLCALQRWGSDAATRLLLENGASQHVRNKEGQTPLHLASQMNSSDIIGSLLKMGADVDARDNNDMTPLLSALEAFGGNDAAVQLLLVHGADVRVRNKEGRTPLHSASCYDHPNIVELLLKSGADVDARDNNDTTPLLSALEAFGGNDAAVQLLLAHGADVHVRNKDGRTPLHSASCSDHPSIVDLLLKMGVDVDARDNDDMTPLLSAVASLHENGATVQLLLAHGADVHVRNKDSQTPLHSASCSGHPSIVEFLLKSGADVDAHDNDNITPLLCALQWWRGGAAARLLLEYGANRHVRNKEGETPLHLASQMNSSDIVALLLKMGVEVDARDNNDMTPLLSALEYFLRNDTVVQLLLVHGADVHVCNKDGETPLHLASKTNSSPHIVALLQKLSVGVGG